MKTYQTYPAMRYHKTLAPDGREVKTADADVALGPGWVDTPAAFDPNYKPLSTPPPDGTPMSDVVAPAKPPEPYPAMRYGRRGGKVKVGTADEDAMLDPAEFKDHPWTVEEVLAAPAPVVSDTPGPAAEPPAPIAASLYFLNATEATLLVAGADTPGKLDVIEAAEQAHPKHVGGRVSVLKAIADRRDSLAAQDAR